MDRHDDVYGNTVRVVVRQPYISETTRVAWADPVHLKQAACEPGDWRSATSCQHLLPLHSLLSAVFQQLRLQPAAHRNTGLGFPLERDAASGGVDIRDQRTRHLQVAGRDAGTYPAGCARAASAHGRGAFNRRPPPHAGAARGTPPLPLHNPPGAMCCCHSSYHGSTLATSASAQPYPFHSVAVCVYGGAPSV